MILYLLLADGTVTEVPGAASAVLDEDEAWLVCYDSRGNEVARFPRLSVTMFSRRPFPTYEAFEAWAG